MSQIPAPNVNAYSNYDYNPYGYRQSDTSPLGGQDPQIQAWLQQVMPLRQSYLAVIRGNGPQKQQAIAYLQQLDQWIDQYTGSSYADQDTSLVQGGDWDPMMQTGPSIIPNGGATQTQTPQTSLSTFIAYQDNSRVVTEDGASCNINVNMSDPDNREIHVFQKSNVLNIPSNAANVTTAVMDDTDVPGKKMLVVTMTQNGQTKKIVFHNIDRDGFKLALHTPDVSQADVSSLGTYASKVEVTELGSVSEQAQGTPSDSAHLWNTNSDVDYYVTQGTEEDKIYADNVNITLQNRSQKAEVTKVGAHEYDITVKNSDGTVVRHVHLYQADSVNIDGTDQENVLFKDTTKTPADTAFTAWSDTAHSADNQLSVGGSNGAQATVTHPDDTAADRTEGNTSYYNTSHDVETHVFDVSTPNLNIQAPGTVTLHGSSFSDTAQVQSYDAATHTWVINFYKDGIRDAAHTRTVTVHGDTGTRVCLDVMGNSSIVDTTDANKQSVQIGVSSAEAPGAGDALNPNNHDDTAPDRVEGNVAYYDNPHNTDVTLNAYFDDAVNTHNITTGGAVDIYPTTNSDTLEVTKVGSNYQIVIHKNGQATPTETFIVSGPPSRINLHALAAKVTNNTGDPKVQVVSGDAESPSTTWPTGQLVANVPTQSDNTDKALDLAQRIETAVRTGNWTQVNAFLDTWETKDWEGNDIVRKVMTGLYKAAGSNQAPFMAFLKMIDPSVRHRLQNMVTRNTGELNEKHDGDQWNSAGTGAQIDASFA
ncbi:MAG: hypothetical protein U1F57_02380 [bacterium]